MTIQPDNNTCRATNGARSADPRFVALVSRVRCICGLTRSRASNTQLAHEHCRVSRECIDSK